MGVGVSSVGPDFRATGSYRGNGSDLAVFGVIIRMYHSAGYGFFTRAQAWDLQTESGAYLAYSAQNRYELSLPGMVLFIGTIVGCIPACRGYRNSLADGPIIRV